MSSQQRNRQTEPERIERHAVAFKARSFGVKASDDGAVIVFEGLGAVFGNEDLGGDIIEPGAFADTLAERMPKMLLHHGFGSTGMTPVGEWTRARETADGLELAGELYQDTEELRLAGRGLKAGVFDGLSIGYYPTEVSWSEDEPEIRRLLKVDLLEVSLVTFPMNPEATVTGIKQRAAAGTLSVREFEGILRDVGFSKTDARAVAAHGLSAVKRRDAAESAELRDLFATLYR